MRGLTDAARSPETGQVIHSDEMALLHGTHLAGLVDLILDGNVPEPREIGNTFGWLRGDCRCMDAGGAHMTQSRTG